MPIKHDAEVCDRRKYMNFQFLLVTFAVITLMDYKVGHPVPNPIDCILMKLAPEHISCVRCMKAILICTVPSMSSF